jgi:hypothetical protein
MEEEIDSIRGEVGFVKVMVMAVAAGSAAASAARAFLMDLQPLPTLHGRAGVRQLQWVTRGGAGPEGQEAIALLQHQHRHQRRRRLEVEEEVETRCQMFAGVTTFQAVALGLGHAQQADYGRMRAGSGTAMRAGWSRSRRQRRRSSAGGPRAIGAAPPRCTTSPRRCCRCPFLKV